MENRSFLCGEQAILMWRIGHSYVGLSELFSCEEVEGGQAILLNRERCTDRMLWFVLFSVYIISI